MRHLRKSSCSLYPFPAANAISMCTSICVIPMGNFCIIFFFLFLSNINSELRTIIHFSSKLIEDIFEL